MLYLITIFSIIIFVINFKRDARSLVNAFLFLLSLGLIYLSAISLAYMRLPIIHSLLLGIMYYGIPVLLVLFALLLIVNGFIVLKKEGKRLSNMLSIFLGVGILAYAIILLLYLVNIRNFLDNIELMSVLSMTFIFITFIFLVFMFIFFSLLVYSLLYLYMPKNKDYDFIIIHGSGLIGGEKVPPLLAARIDKAIGAYHLREKENAKLIASGGQGSDEKISEARAIANYLLERGIPENAIVLEDQSKTTYENLQYSKALAEQQVDNPKYLFISNDYHIFRTSYYARKLKMDGNGVGARTAGYYIPSAFIREYIAILKRLRLIVGTMILLFLIFLLVTYLY